MGKKVIALASGDWHIHNFRQHAKPTMSRLDWCLKMVKELAHIAKSYGVPHLFTGDLVHSPKEAENETLTRFVKVFTENFRNQPFIGISGNHDLSQKNSIEHRSPSWLGLIQDKITFLDNCERTAIQLGIGVWGVPYMNYDQDMVTMVKRLTKDRKSFKGKAILLLHSDFPGAKTPEGFEVAETEHIPRDLDKFFKDWDLVLCGHIHKAQRLSKKVYMLGTPMQLDAGQEGEKCGYWLIYEDMSVKHMELKDYPKFITLQPGESPKETHDFYITPRAESDDDEVSNGEFIMTNTRSKLAKNYCKVKGIKSKEKKRALIQILNQAE
jgi:DNA repair exonuclease SbcCD nuclease subunit